MKRCQTRRRATELYNLCLQTVDMYYFKNVLAHNLFISLLMYSQDVSVGALFDKFMFNPVKSCLILWENDHNLV